MPKFIAFGSLAAAVLQLVLVTQFHSDFLVMLRKGGGAIGPVSAFNVAAFFALSALCLGAASWAFVRSKDMGVTPRVASFLAAAGLVAGCAIFSSLLSSGALSV